VNSAKIRQLVLLTHRRRVLVGSELALMKTVWFCCICLYSCNAMYSWHICSRSQYYVTVQSLLLKVVTATTVL